MWVSVCHLGGTNSPGEVEGRYISHVQFCDSVWCTGDPPPNIADGLGESVCLVRFSYPVVLVVLSGSHVFNRVNGVNVSKSLKKKKEQPLNSPFIYSAQALLLSSLKVYLCKSTHVLNYRKIMLISFRQDVNTLLYTQRLTNSVRVLPLTPWALLPS